MMQTEISSMDTETVSQPVRFDSENNELGLQSIPYRFMSRDQINESQEREELVALEN